MPLIPYYFQPLSLYNPLQLMSPNRAAILKPAALNPLFTNAPEDGYAAMVSDSHRKQFGQFFTPVLIAEFMARWITGNRECRTILDPSVGLGIFFRAIDKIGPQSGYKLVGYDIDPTILSEAKSLLSTAARPGIELSLKDYLFNDWHKKYDGIICNPPYFKFQDYKNRAACLKEFQSRLKVNLSGFTNIYTMFLLKAVSQLAAGGRAAFLVPFEFLNADYGTIIKKHLLESKTLRYLILFNSKENVFNNALTTSCILLLANDFKAEAVTFTHAHNADNLEDIFGQIAAYPNDDRASGKVPHDALDPDIKWRAYYQRQRGEKLRNLVPLSTYGKVVRGIATGANDYFTFDEKKKAEFQIEERFLLPCLTKALQADNSFFTRTDFDKLRARGGRVLLFNASDAADKAVKKYLELGEKLEVNERYLTKHRTPWYAIENRRPAPILVTVFNRAGLRFVRNEAGLRNLTCFHGLYLNPSAAAKVELLMAYFISDISKEVLNDNRREYGGGLHKFEPNDLNRAKVLDLEAVEAQTERRILSAYRSYRESVLRSEANACALKTLNDIFSSILA